MSNKALAIIPARGGSKRIPQKNIKLFLGKPIIQYSIDAAMKSDFFDEIMVSTDNEMIAKVAIESGASVPFLRSSKNSDDFAGLEDVIEEVLLRYQKQNIFFEYFCCILATAPFVSSENIQKGMRLLIDNHADSVVAVTKFSYPIQRAFKIENNELVMLWPENCDVRSQDLITSYHDCGQCYWMKVDSFFKQKKIYAKKTIPLIISELEQQDIDTEEDWKIAEIKYKFYISSK